MNNGVNTNVTNTNTNEQPVLTPMEGVRLAPAMETPVNASSTSSATSAVASLPKPQATTTQPQIVQATPVTPASQPQIISPVPNQPQISPVPQEGTPQQTTPTPPENVIPAPPAPVPTKKSKIAPFLLLIIILLGSYIVYSTKQHREQIDALNYNCTPITASKEEQKLDINSTIVKSLYQKVYTTIYEDLAQPEFNDEMRLYLAYRQITETEKYDSNCNLFSKTSMEPYLCENITNFRPKAFKEETLQQAIKELYGENTTIPFKNIQLRRTCVVGYQYIPARGEFVEGYCAQKEATSYKVTKTLEEAISTKTTIILKEEVKYHENEQLELPSSLKSGYYYYTFRLDMNYNYVLIDKSYESKY